MNDSDAMVKTRPLLALLLFILSQAAFAQSDDFGLDFSLQGQKKLMNKRLTLNVEGNFRTQDNSRRAERYGVSVGAKYKIIDYKNWTLTGGLEYTHLWVQNLAVRDTAKYEMKYDYYNVDANGMYYEVEEEEYDGLSGIDPIYKGYNKGYNYTDRFWRDRDRYSASLGLKYEPNKRWSFSLVEIVQFTHYYKKSTSRNVYREKYRLNGDDELYLKETVDSLTVKSYSAKDRVMLKSRLGVAYNIRHCPLTPFCDVEYGCGLNYTNNRWKFTVGSEWSLGKKDDLEFFYRYKHEGDEEDPNGHYIGLGYTHKF